MSAKRRQTVCVDFDGVIHSYTTPWEAEHVIPDPPIEGALEWLVTTLKHFDVVIHTTRAKTMAGRSAIRRWLRQHGGEALYRETMEGPGLESVTISNRKLPAIVYIDDRAWRFDGEHFPTRNEIYQALPWWKKK